MYEATIGSLASWKFKSEKDEWKILGDDGKRRERREMLIRLSAKQVSHDIICRG